MTSRDVDFLSREELLGGLPARRASTLLFVIESRTAQLVARAHQATALYLPPSAAQEREREFLQALAAGRDLPLQPTVQDLERYAPNWASLVPEDAATRASIAHVLAKKHRFNFRSVPQLRAALGLDSAAVQEAYRRHYDQPLSTVYAPRTALGERLRWGWTAVSDKLESLPPFWTAFALTLPGAAGLLALPIALARVSFTTAVFIILVFGLINTLTVAALAEVVARSGTSRFGLGFLGQLALEYLGRAGSLFVTVVLALNNFFILIIFYLGVAGTLEDATALPAELWVAVLFGACLYFLSRRSLNATVSTALIIIFVNVMALLAIPVLALFHFRPDNLPPLRLPFAGESFAPATWQLILGIMLSTFFSHIMVAAYGAVVLRRDPGGRSWIKGSVFAIVVFMLIACLWMVAVNGAVPSAVLASTAGTVLAPLAEVVGPGVHVLGAVLVTLSLGLASVQIALVLYYLAEERMPSSPNTRLLGNLGKNGRFFVAISPVLLAFVLTEWITVTGLASFTGFLGVLSALVLPLLGGVFPVLLVAATRRKGDFVPDIAAGFVGHPVTLVLLYLFFLTSILLHGFVIWEAPLARILALVVGAVVLAVTYIALRRGMLDGRTVVELRDDQSLGGTPMFSVTARGRRAVADVRLVYRDGERRLSTALGTVPDFRALCRCDLQLPSAPVRELKVWTHRITPELSSACLPALLVLQDGAKQQEFDMSLSGGQVLMPLADTRVHVQITLADV